MKLVYTETKVTEREGLEEICKFINSLNCHHVQFSYERDIDCRNLDCTICKIFDYGIKFEE